MLKWINHEHRFFLSYNDNLIRFGADTSRLVPLISLLLYWRYSLITFCKYPDIFFLVFVFFVSLPLSPSLLYDGQINELKLHVLLKNFNRNYYSNLYIKNKLLCIITENRTRRHRRKFDDRWFKRFWEIKWWNSV